MKEKVKKRQILNELSIHARKEKGAVNLGVYDKNKEREKVSFKNVEPNNSKKKTGKINQMNQMDTYN